MKKSKTDKAGNVFKVTEDGSCYITRAGLLRGKVAYLGEERHEGGKIIFEKSEHTIYYTFDGITFPHDLIQWINPDIIKVKWNGDDEEWEQGCYYIKRKDFEESIKGKVINWKSKGYEIKCYVPIDDFTEEED